MDKTLEFVDPSSYNDTTFLCDKDLSLSSHGQKSILKTNLSQKFEMPDFDETSTISSLDLNTVKVYLRMKPFPKCHELTQEQMEAYKIVDDTTLITKLPVQDSENISSLKKLQHNGIICRKFKFTKTFGPETKQLEIFEQAVKPLMIDFFAGKNCVIMTYGTTNAGKSHTLQGSSSSPGIIPRSLEFIFSQILPTSTPIYKPVQYRNVACLTSFEQNQEIKAKSTVLSSYFSDQLQFDKAYKNMQTILKTETQTKLDRSKDVQYVVYVSFAEIYNESVYDLLSKNCSTKNSSLKIVTDHEGQTFIRGLKTVFVNSGCEAYQVLMAGKRNLKFAATALNTMSSRSHCIFIIKLLKYHKENDPDSVEVTTFSFCDLAGSERLKTAMTYGDRLKEAQNINTSLLVLGKCLKSIYEGQLMQQKYDHITSFRESKLTRLFQNALSGKDTLALIANINPLPNFYMETQNVLKFCAIARKIIIKQTEKKTRKNKSRFSQIVTQSINTVTNWDHKNMNQSQHPENEIPTPSVSIYSNEFENLLKENELLKQENATLKHSALQQNFEIRNEMANNCTAILQNLETFWRDQMKSMDMAQQDLLDFTVNQMRDFYEAKLQNLQSKSRKTPRENELDDESYKGSDKDDNEQLKALNEQLSTQVKNLQNLNMELVKEKNLSMTEKNTLTFELQLLKNNYEKSQELLEISQKSFGGNVDDFINEMKVQLSASHQHEKMLKTYLNEAKEDYLSVLMELKEKDEHIKRQEVVIIENEEKLTDLDKELYDTNILLAETKKKVQKLEGYIPQTSDKDTSVKNKTEIPRKMTNQTYSQFVIKEDKSNVNLEEQHTSNMLNTNKMSTFAREVHSSSQQLVELDELQVKELKRIKAMKVDRMEIGSQTDLLEEENTQSIEYECLQKNYDELKNQFRERCKEIDELREDLDNQINKCKNEHKKKINELEQELCKTKNEQIFDIHVERISLLEKELEFTETRRAKEVQELSAKINTCQIEKQEVLRNLNDRCKRIEELEDQLNQGLSKERERDDEIDKLQRELKAAIKKIEAIELYNQNIETKFENTMEELKSTKEELFEKRMEINNLKMHVKTYESNMNSLDSLHQIIEDNNFENSQLRETIEKLKQSLLAKEYELETFRKNRNDTIYKYENLVKTQQEELDKQKQEIINLQVLSPKQIKHSSSIKKRQPKESNFEDELKGSNKENVHNKTSDEGTPYTLRGRRKIKKEISSPSNTVEDFIDTCHSEFKGSSQPMSLLKPTSEKITRRRKKLFDAKDEIIDIKPLDSALSSTVIPVRNLRSRKKIEYQ